jgi:site-specific recombinase XerD
MSSFDWPWQLYRPAGDGGPRPELFDPYDEPLPLEQRSKTTWPGFHKGRTAPNKGKRFPIEILTPMEVAVILGGFPTDERCGIRNRALIAVLYRAGLRVNEARHLRSKDIDPGHGMIRVLFGKGQRARTVGIDQGGIDFIEAWQRERSGYDYPDDAPLFCTSTGRLLGPSSIRTFITRVGKEVGITKRVHPHGFRHAFAFELVMEGVPLPIIQIQLGHVWATSTCSYINHIAPTEVISRIRERTWILPPDVQAHVSVPPAEVITLAIRSENRDIRKVG